MVVGRVFANGLEDQGSIPGGVIPKTLKMVLDTSLLNTQQYKVHINGKEEQSRERSSTFPYTSVQQLLKKEPSGRPRLQLPDLLTFYLHIEIYIYIYILYIYIYMCVCVSVCVYTCIYIYIYVCVCVYIHANFFWLQMCWNFIFSFYIYFRRTFL